MSSRGPDSARVYIGDLGSGGSKPELEREFERYGPLKSVWVARNPPGESSAILFTSVLLAALFSYCELWSLLIKRHYEL